MATQTQPRTHCPTCGAKLHRTDLSLCAYCATPLSIADEPGAIDDETIRRLKRLRDHKLFGAALAYTPLDHVVEQRRGTLLTVGTLALLLGIGPALALAWNAIEGGPWIVWAAATAICALVGLSALWRRAMLRRTAGALAMLRRPALVVTRRSETDADGAGTTYFFTLRFDDGAEGEFAWPARGAAYEPLSNGYTGIAYTRGTVLVDFRRLT